MGSSSTPISKVNEEKDFGVTLYTIKADIQPTHCRKSK